MDDCQILIGDVRAKLRELPENSVQCVVTSPPYWGLRDYGTEPQVFGGRADCPHEWVSAGKRHRGGPQGATGDRATRDTSAQDATGDIKQGAFCAHCNAWLGELGLEPTPQLFVEHIVEVFREVHRVLKKDGTCWVNMGDCYVSGAAGKANRGERRPAVNGRGEDQVEAKGYRGGRGDSMGKHGYRADLEQPNRKPIPWLKAKDLVGQPWLVAFGLQADGWYLRQDIIWHKPNPMPESIRDRCTKAHEYLFLLSKSPRYYFDAGAIKEACTGGAHERARKDRASMDTKCAPSTLVNGIRPRLPGVNPKALTVPAGWAVGPGSHTAIDHNRGPRRTTPKQNASFAAAVASIVTTRNARSVWRIPTEPYPEAHYATFPSALPRRCILAGSRPGDIVLDPFGGSGTTGAVANALGRPAILIDLNPANEPLMRARIAKGMVARKSKRLREHSGQLELIT